MKETAPITVAEGITVHPDIMGGVPCIAGNRWPTSIASDYARKGFPVSHIMAEYPWITAKQIANALAWQARPFGNRKKAIASAMARYEEPG
jgi:uncharacterized protein (DUF433 family)